MCILPILEVRRLRCEYTKWSLYPIHSKNTTEQRLSLDLILIWLQVSEMWRQVIPGSGCLLSGNLLAFQNRVQPPLGNGHGARWLLSQIVILIHADLCQKTIFLTLYFLLLFPLTLSRFLPEKWGQWRTVLGILKKGQWRIAVLSCRLDVSRLNYFSTHGDRHKNYAQAKSCNLEAECIRNKAENIMGGEVLPAWFSSFFQNEKSHSTSLKKKQNNNKNSAICLAYVI